MAWCLGATAALAQAEQTEAPVKEILPADSVVGGVADSLRQKVLVADSLRQQVFRNDSLRQQAGRLRMSRAALRRGQVVLPDSAEVSRMADSLTVTLHNLKPQTFVPNPIRSMWLALVFPGAGQIYNHKYWKLPIFYGGFLGCVYAFSWNSQMLKDYTQAYLDIMDNDPNTKSYEKMLPLGYDITGKEERFKDIFKRKKDYFRKYRDMSIFAFAGVYLLSIIDAYVDAELSTFDISRDLSIHWEPTLMNGEDLLQRRYGQRAVGVQCSLNF